MDVLSNPGFAALLVFLLVLAGAWLTHRLLRGLEAFVVPMNNPLEHWRTRKLVSRLTEMVLLIGDRTDGELKG